MLTSQRLLTGLRVTDVILFLSSGVTQVLEGKAEGRTYPLETDAKGSELAFTR